MMTRLVLLSIAIVSLFGVDTVSARRAINAGAAAISAAGVKPLKVIERPLEDGTILAAKVFDPVKLGALGLSLRAGQRVSVELFAGNQFKVTRVRTGEFVILDIDANGNVVPVR